MKQPLDYLRSNKRPVTRTVWLSLNDELADQVNAAQERARQLRAMSDSKPRDRDLKLQAELAEEEADELLAEMRRPENSAKFVARSLPRQDFEDLQNEFPATDEQRKQAKKDGIGEITWDPDTFPPALITRCVVFAYSHDLDTGEPFGIDSETGKPIERYAELTPEFVDEIWNSKDATESDEHVERAEGGAPKWNHAEVMSLFSAAFEANQSRRVVDLGNGSRRTRR